MPDEGGYVAKGWELSSGFLQLCMEGSLHL